MHISLAAEVIVTIFGFPITNSMLMTWLAMAILIVIGLAAASNPKTIPGKLQNAVEAVLEYALNLADSIIQNRQITLTILPIVATLFLLIVLSNWLGLVPGVGTIGFEQTIQNEKVLQPLLRPTNADINATLGWAIIAGLTAQFMGIASLGFIEYSNKFLNLRSLRQGGFQGFIDFFVGILESFSEISKLISFSFRLFGNIFAGEVLLTVVAFLAPYIAPLPFYFLELFVGLIQGLVFVTLTLVFIKIAITGHGHSADLVVSH